jgi:hypothetical protein
MNRAISVFLLLIVSTFTSVAFSQAPKLKTTGNFKPRGQWHTFWNAGDQPLRILELISPGGFDEAFIEMDALGNELTPEKM